MDPLITFDAGQTIIELDLDLLARRLGERGVRVAPAALAEALPAAWRRYDELVDASRGHPWQELMATLLSGAGVGTAEDGMDGMDGMDGIGGLVDWLWREQPRVNLWRRPIEDMVALARELAAAGVAVAVLSNSEGRLAELLEEIGLAAPFAAIVDSGKLGIEKPDRRIFEHALARTGRTAGVHIGDSWSADIEGALGAGWRAVWFGRRAAPVADPRVAVARSAAEVRAALARWGVPGVSGVPSLS
ncbi:MAG TPA: HAD family hydrolase [Kofleriaceae bacterium]|nr:HAD family hydrolase [Kofleriaceae bacterium]